MVSVITLLQPEAVVTTREVERNVDMHGIHFDLACFGDWNGGRWRGIMVLMYQA